MKKTGIGMLMALMILTALASCNSTDARRIEDNLFALDTFITFSISDGEDSRKGLDTAMERIREIEERMSVTLPNSDIYKVNENAGKQPAKVHADTFYVINKAIQYAVMTDGAFDISMLPVSRLWDISGNHPRVPEKEEIDRILPLVDYKKIRLDEQNQTVFLEQEGMSIDLGGIAKGYAGDEVARILKEHGVAHALVNLGGNIVVINSREDGSPWRVGIQNPRVEDDPEKRRHVAVVQAAEKAVITSGDYERYMAEVYEKTGERYHHILDPNSGYPAKSGVISVTIVFKSGIDADALTTALFVMGVKDGLKLVNELDGIDAMMITDSKEIHFSEGFQDQVSGIHSDYHIAD